MLRYARVFDCRGQPGGCAPFLFRQERCTKEGDPIPPPSATLRVPCVARQAGRLRNSAFQSSPKAPDLAALLGGEKGGRKTKHPIPILALLLAYDSAWAFQPIADRSPFRGRGRNDYPFSLRERVGERGGSGEDRLNYVRHPLPPLHRLGFPKKSGAVGEDCLSAKRESRSRPIFSENRG